MCLDYILQVIPCVQRPGTALGDPNCKIPVGLKLDGKCSVRQFFVDKETEGQGKVSQTSDHYGVLLDFYVK